MNETSRTDLAVIGMSGEFPGALDIDQFWQNLLAGKESISKLSEEECRAAGVDEALMSASAYVRRSAHIARAKCFDAGFFGYTDLEAEQLDPQHRLFLQHCWAALESACYLPDEVPGLVGVFAGCGFNRYLLNKLKINTREFGVDDFQRMLASDKDFLTTRVSYKLNLGGPSVNVQSGCSTSLVAIQMGVVALQSYQCDIALCGGVSINVPHAAGYKTTDSLIFSPDGHCRPFSARARGTVFGEGVGVVALKRLDEALEDGDVVHAVVRGAAVNNDGADKVGYTAPSVSGQAGVISLAQQLADVQPSDIDFIETHGTATRLGDPIEIEGLKSVFGDSEARCALGTLKANVGHLDAAAGVAAFIKTVLIVKHRKIPPCLYANEICKSLEVDRSPFYFNDQIVDLSLIAQPLIAGVSSFGIGGTNAHVILSSPPQKALPDDDNGEGNNQASNCMFIPVSAKSAAGVRRYQKSVAEFSTRYPNKNRSLAYTMASVRKSFAWKGLVKISDEGGVLRIAKTEAVLSQPADKGIAFVFTGQAMQFAGMACALYHYSVEIKSIIDCCLALCEKNGLQGLRELLLDPEDSAEESLLDQTEYSQPALFITEYALAKCLLNKGIRPSLVLGHSLGEYVAACIAGVFSLEDAIKIVCSRSQLMADTEPGAMLSVVSSNKIVEKILPKSLDVALVNSPAHTVVSGSREEINAFQEVLHKRGTEARRLRVSRAFHSRYMDPILKPFENIFDGVRLSPAEIPILSMTHSFRGAMAPHSDPNYWKIHLREAVNFDFGARLLLESGIGVIVEIGPGKGLQSLLKMQPGFDSNNVSFVSTISRIAGSKRTQQLDDIVMDLWAAGVPLDLEVMGLVKKAPLIDAPTYPFEPDQYWLPDIAPENVNSAETSEDRPDLESLEDKILAAWRTVYGQDVEADENFLDLGGDSLSAIRLAGELTAKLDRTVALPDIFKYPTVSAMAEFVRMSQQDTTKTNMLFPIDDRGTGNPLFLIAGAHVDGYFVEGKSKYEEAVYRYFSTLVKHLGGKRPVMGFRPKGVYYGEEVHASVEAMASDCIQCMRDVQPRGPYLLAGECVGGIVAYEMARQLLAAGEEVQQLILMDTRCPGRLFQLTELNLVRWRRVRKFGIRCYRSFTAGDFKALSRDVKKALKHAAVYLFPLSSKQRLLRNAIFGSQLYLKLLLRYRPKTLTVPVHLLVNQEWFDKSPSMGWQVIDEENLNILPVRGTHKTRLTVFGHQLGDIINRIIE